MEKVITLGCDHIGLLLKEPIKNYLKEVGYELFDVGTYDDISVDYPQFAKEACKKINSDLCNTVLLFCGTGVGMSIAANKMKGVRAVVCSEPYSAKMAKEHNNANVLCLGSRVIGVELAKTIVDTWLVAKFEGGRHSRRVDMFDQD